MDDPLLLGQADIERRAQAADAYGDYDEARLLFALAGCADFVRRVALPTASAHYRSDKSGELLACAVRLHWLCLDDYAGQADGGVLEDGGAALAKVVEAVSGLMWAAARRLGHGGADIDLAAFHLALSRLKVWAGEVEARTAEDS